MIRKLIASLTATCFLFSFVIAPAVQATVRTDTSAPAAGLSTPGEFLPSRFGMVTRLHDFGSETVVVNIQDLHCHAEVQRNISGILQTLVEGYHLDRVFIEGASGDLDTSWLAGVKDAALKKELSDSLLKQGRLTGSEYYSIMNGRPRLLSGIENEQAHRANIVRLGRLLENSGGREQAVRQLSEDIDSLQARYFSSRNRRFSRLVELHRKGKISSPKYYAALEKYVKNIQSRPRDYGAALPGGMDDYPNITGFLRLQELGKRLNYKLAVRQMSAFLQELKSRLPWNDYNDLLKHTGNLSDFDAVCGALAPYYRQPGYDAPARFPQLGPLFAFAELKRRVNPLELVGEERRLAGAVRSALARNEAERDVSFLVDFTGCFEDYLSTQISAEEYAYVTGRYGEFRRVLGKYVAADRLASLSADTALLGEYYRVNEDRTRTFLQYMLPGGAPAHREFPPENTGASPGALLGGAREIVVVVTGGFHTEGLEKLLGEKKISSIVVTPSVREDTHAAEALYRSIIEEQGREFAAAPAGQAPAEQGRLVALNTMQYAVETSRSDHVRALGLGLLDGGDTIDEAKATELGLTVSRDGDDRTVTLSDGKVRRRLALPLTVGRTLRAAPSAVFAGAKKMASTVLLKTGESTSLGYWAAKALFPYDTERQRAWGRRVLPLQTAALAAFFLLSPTAGIGAAAGGLVVQQMLKLAAAKRAHELSSPWKYFGSALRDTATYGLFMAVPAGIGISYAFLPFFVSNPVSFGVFCATFVLSAVFNLHRLGGLKWSAPSLIATFALAGFIVPPVMGSIGAVSMPVVAWTQVAAILYSAAMSAVLLVSRGGEKRSPLAHFRRAASRVTACLLVLFLMFPTQTASMTRFAPVPPENVSTVSLWEGVPSLLHPDDIVQVLTSDPAYYENALSSYIRQMDNLTILKFNALYSDSSFGPLQRKIQNIMDNLPRDPAVRAGIAEHIRFSSDIQKRAFIDYGVLVVGASKIDLVHMTKILAILPPAHYRETTLVFFSPLYDQEEYKGMNFDIVGKRFIVIMDAEGYSVGAHEVGHSVGPTASFCALSARSGKDLINYERQYGMKNAFEDWATIYAAWVTDSADLAARMGQSSLFEAKIREVLKKFVVTEDGKTYLRVYGKWNLGYTDVPFDGDLEHADLAALAAKSAVPDTLEAQVLAEISAYDSDGAKALVEEQFKDVTPQQMYDLIYSVFTLQGSDAVKIAELMAAKGLVALPSQITFDYVEANVHSWEDLVLLGNMAPQQMNAVLLSDRDRLYRMIDGFPPVDGRFLVYMDDADDLTFMPQFFGAIYTADRSLALKMLTRFPDLITNVAIPPDMTEMVEDYLFNQVIDWTNAHTLDDKNPVRLEIMVLDYALRQEPASRAVFLDHVAQLYHKANEDYGKALVDSASRLALLNDAFAARDYARAGTCYDGLLKLLSNGSVNRWFMMSFVKESDLQATIWFRAQTDPAGALHMISEKEKALLGDEADLDFLTDNKPLALAMLNADPAAAANVLDGNPFLGKLIGRGSAADADFVASLITSVGPGTAAASMNAYYWSLTSGGKDGESAEAQAIIASFKDFARYIPASSQDLYTQVIDRVGGEKPQMRPGTMLVNKPRAMQWANEGRSGWYIAARIALRETLPRMIAPHTWFIAGHAPEDRASARSIVRAGRWGGFVGGLSGALVSVAVLLNAGFASPPISWLLMVPLSAIAGWAVGRFIVGGVQQVAIDTVAYAQPGSRAGPHAGATVAAGLLKAAEPTSFGYWIAKALFPYEIDRQQAWGRRVVPFETAALSAFFLLSPAAGVCALAGGFAVRQLLKLAAVKRSGETVSGREFAGSALKEASTYFLFMALPAAVGIAYAVYPLFVGNYIGFALFAALAVWSASFNLNRLHGMKWSSPSLIATFSLLGLVVLPVMGSIGALAMPVVAWTQVAAIVYTAAMLVAVPVSRGGLRSLSPSHLRLAWARVLSCVLVLFIMFPSQAVSSALFEPAGRAPAQTEQAGPSLWQGVPSVLNPVDMVRVLTGDTGYYEEQLNDYLQQLEGMTLPRFSELESSRYFGPLQRKIQDILKVMPRDPAGRALSAESIRFSSDQQKRIFVNHGVLLVGGSTVERAYMENLLDSLPASEVGKTSLIYIEPMPADRTADGKNYGFLDKSFVVLRTGEDYAGGHEVGHTAGPTAAFWLLNAASGGDLTNYQNDYGMTNAFEDWATIYAAWVEDSSGVVSKMESSDLYADKVREVLKKFVFTHDGQTFLRVYKWNTYTDVPFTGGIADVSLAPLVRQYVPHGYASLLALIESGDPDSALVLAQEQMQTATPEEYYTLMYMVYSHSSNAASRISTGLAGKPLASIPSTLTFDFLEAHVHSWEDLALIGNLNPDQLSSLLFSDQARANRLMESFPDADGQFLRLIDGMSFMYTYFESVYATDPALARSLAAQYPELTANIPLPVNIDEDGMKFAEWFLFTQKMDWNDPDSQISLKDEQFLSMTIDYALRLSPAERTVFLDDLARQNYPMAKDFGPLFSDIVGARASMSDALAGRDYAAAGKQFNLLLGLLQECEEISAQVNKQKGHIRLASDRIMNPMLVFDTITDADMQAMVLGLAQTDPAAALHLLTERQHVGFDVGIDIRFLLENKPLAIAMFKADPAAAQEMLAKNRFVGQVIAGATADDAGFIADLINAVGPDAAAASMEEHRLWLVIGQRSSAAGERMGNEAVEAYKNFAQYLPESMQKTYQSILAKIDAPSGTMLVNKTNARQWVREGRSGWYIALRLALRETLPRMIAPQKRFVAGHRDKDKTAARSIVRAGKWGGIAAGTAGVLASAGLLWNLASSSPLSWALFVTLSGIAGWSAGRLVVGALRQIAIDAAAYRRADTRPLPKLLRAPAFVFTHVKKFVSAVLFRTGETTSLGYWVAKALFPYDAERQQKWGRRTIPIETAALGAFFLMSPTAGICALAGGLAVQQLLKLTAVKRSVTPVSRKQYIGSTVRELAAFGLFAALPAAIGISYAFVPLFMSNSISFVVFSALVAVSAVYNLHRLHALKWSSPALVATFALLGFTVPPVMGCIAAVAMPVVAWTQVATIVYTTAMAVTLLALRGGTKSASPFRVRLLLRRVTATLLVLLFMFPSQAMSAGVFAPAHPPSQVQTVQIAPSLWDGVPSLLNPVDIVRVLDGDPGYYEDALSAYIKQMDSLTVTQYDDLAKSITFGPLQRKIQNIMNALPQDPAGRAAMAENIRFGNDIQKQVFIDHGILLAGANTVEQVYLKNLLDSLPTREVNETTLVMITPLPSESKADGINYHVVGKVFIVLKGGRAEVGGHEIGHTAGPTGAFWDLSSASGDDLANYENAYGMTNSHEDWATIYAAWVKDSGALVSTMQRSANFEAKIREVARKFVTTKDGTTFLRVYKWNTYTDVPFTGDLKDADLAALTGQYAPTGVALIAEKLDTGDYDAALALARQQLQAASPEDYYATLYMIYAVSSNSATKISQGLAGTGIAGLPGTLTFDFLEAHVRSWEDLALVGNLYPGQLGSVLFSDQARANRLMASFTRADADFLRIIEGMTPLYDYFAALYAADPAQAISLAAQYPDLITNMPLPRDLRGLDAAGMKFAEWFLFTQKMDWSDPYSQESLKNEEFLRMTLDYAMQLPQADRETFLSGIASQHFPMAKNFGPMFAGIVAARALLSDDLAVGDYARASEHFETLLNVLEDCEKNGELVREKKSDEDGTAFAADRVFNPMMIFETITDADLQAMVWARAQSDPAGALHLIADRQRAGFNVGIDIQFLLENKPLALAMFKADPAAGQEMFVKNRFAGQVIAGATADDAAFVADLINAVGPDAVAASMEEHRVWLVIGQRSSFKGEQLGRECMEAYRNFAQYLPDSMQATYQSMLDQIDVHDKGAGTMLVNKPRAAQWVREGRSGWYIAVRLALREMLPRMISPRTFVAGHADEDKATARSIVQAGKWGGIAAGIGGVLASAGLLGNLASSSPLSWLLFVTLTGIAGWTAGRLIVGGVQQISIDAAVYKHLSLHPVKADAPSVPAAGSDDDAMYRAYRRLMSAS